MANQTITKCLIGEARMNFVKVFTPEEFDNGEKKYQVLLSFPKTDKKLLQTVQNAIEECRRKAEQTMFHGRLPKNFNLPNIKDGDEDYEEGKGFPGEWVIKASSSFKPEVVKKAVVMGKTQLVPITDEDEFYSGCYGYASVVFFAYDSQKSKGISCGLNSLLKSKDGERFGGSRENVDEAFAGVLGGIDTLDDLPGDDDIF